MEWLLARRSALRIALAYAFFGILWILFSDRAAEALTDTAAELSRWQSYKGGAFVVLSAAVIYFLVAAEQRMGRWQEDLLRNLCSLFPDPMTLRRLDDGRFVAANDGFAELVGMSRETVMGRSLDELDMEFRDVERDAYERLVSEDGEAENFLLHVTGRDGAERALLLSSRRVDLNHSPHLLTVVKDVTELEETQRRLEEQLHRLRALRDIDLAITGSVDVDVALKVALDQVVERLDVDAADILLASPQLRSLEFGAGRGFRTPALRHTKLQFGEGLAGRAAEEREMVVVPDLATEAGAFERSPHLEEEGFVSYVAVPLEAKGEVLGVLELFTRTPLRMTGDWREFLEALAGQAAIAVDSATLLRRLRRSNEDLRRAYDQTIAGWARALEIRDRETQGHTERATELTVRLARRLGTYEEELVHIRRGALLHDIGKLGVPDAILLKPGPLDDEEWEVMQEHPVLAHRLLAPIEFLRPALDIPYCHHEKWDGSGYPRGLERREIPFGARVFAVVDVWDALRSDRPYRDAWPEEEVREHLREEAGSHFDPEVVAVFLEMLEEGVLEEGEAEAS